MVLIMPEFWKEHPARFYLFFTSRSKLLCITCLSPKCAKWSFHEILSTIFLLWRYDSKNLVCSFVFPMLPLFYPNMVCEQLPNPIRIARKCLMRIKKTSIPFRFHLSSLSSDFFANLFEASFSQVSAFMFFWCFRLLDKHSRRSNPFLFITKCEVWAVFMVCFFFNGRFWDISSMLPDLFVVSLCAFVFEYAFQSIYDLMYIYICISNFVVPHHVPTKWPAPFKRLRSWVVVDAYLCSSCCKAIWKFYSLYVFFFSPIMPCKMTWQVLFQAPTRWVSIGLLSFSWKDSKVEFKTARAYKWLYYWCFLPPSWPYNYRSPSKRLQDGLAFWCFPSFKCLNTII